MGEGYWLHFGLGRLQYATRKNVFHEFSLRITVTILDLFRQLDRVSNPTPSNLGVDREPAERKGIIIVVVAILVVLLLLLLFASGQNKLHRCAVQEKVPELEDVPESEDECVSYCSHQLP